MLEEKQVSERGEKFLEEAPQRLAYWEQDSWQQRRQYTKKKQKKEMHR